MKHKFMFLLLAAAAWLLPATVHAQCDGTECSISFEMTDGYADGWNQGGGIEVYQNDELIQKVTLASGASGTATVPVCSSYEVVLKWVSGNYDDEDDFLVYNGDGTIVAMGNGDDYDDGEEITSFDVECPSCLPVSNLAVSDVTTDGMTLSWTSSNASATYTITYSDGENDIVISSIDATSYTFTGLAAGTSYTFSVVAVCDEDETSGAATITAATNVDCDKALCTIQLTLTDSYDDGWNGGSIAAYQDGEEVWTYALANGASGIVESYTFCPSSPLEFRMASNSQYANEMGVTIVDGVGNTVYSQTGFNNNMVGQTMVILDDPCPTCIRPTEITLEEATASSLSFSWTPAGEESQWMVYLEGSDESEIVSTTEYTFDGLEGNTLYTVCVRAICGDGDTSAAATAAFSTACGTSTCEVTVQLTSNYPYGGNYPWSYGGSVTVLSGETEVATINSTSSVEVCGSSPVSVRFNGSNYSYYNSYGVVTLLDGGGAQVAQQSGSLTEGSIVATAESPCPSCIPVKDITVSDLTSSEATISWTPRSDATTFVLYLGGEELDLVEDATEYTLTELNENTNYTIGIMSLCSDEDSSAVATYTFRTLCGEMVLPYTVDFEDVPFNGAFPSCWDSIMHSGTDPSVNTANGNHTDGGQYAMYFRNGGEQMIVSREVPVDGDKVYVDFWALVNNNAVMKAGVMTDKNDTSTFIPLVTIEGNGSTWTEYEFNTAIAGDAAEHYYVAWYTNGGGVCKVDDILISEYEGCERPANTWVVNDATGVYEATVAWNGVDVATGYTVYYNKVNDNSDIEALESFSTADTFAVLTDLDPNTTYYAWVATNCSASSTPMKYIGYFTTQISCANVQNVTLENITYVAAEISWVYNTTTGFPTSGVHVVLTDNSDEEAEAIEYDAPAGETSHLFTGLTAGHSYTASFYNYCDIPTVAGKTDTANAVNLNFMTTSCSEISGTTTSQNVPENTYYGNSISQMLYTADMMPPVSSFSGISFNVTTTQSNNSDRTWDVYLGLSDKESFADGSDWIDFSSLTLVASDYTFNVNQSGWQEVVFDAPFTYETGKTLVVAINDKRNAYTPGNSAFGALNASAHAIQTQRDNTNYDPADPPSANMRDQVAAIRFSTTCEAPTCYAPMLHVTDVDSTSVSLEWYQIGTESQFALWYRADGSDTWIDEGSVADFSTIFSGLNGNTVYYFRVGSICGTDTLWSVISARTECAPLSVPFFDGFENTPINDAPLCWTMGIPFAYSSTITFPRVENQGNESAKATRFYGYGPAMLTTDEIPLAADQIAIQLDIRTNNASTNTFVIGLATDPTDASTFIALDTITNTSYETKEYYSANIASMLDLTAKYRLAFYYESTYQYASADIDNVNILLDDGCHRAKNFVAEADTVDVHAINLSWTNDGNGTTAIVRYKTSDASVYTDEEVTMTDDTTAYTLDDLEAATIYNIMVGIVCSGDTLWTKELTEGTGCAPIALPHSEDFEAYAQDVLPMCWTYDGTGSGTPHTHYDGGLFFRSNNNHAPVVLPEFESPLGKLQIEFDVKVGSIAENDGLMIGAADANGNLIEWIDTLQSELYSRNAYQHVVYNFLDYYGEGERVAFAQLRSWDEWMCMDNFYVIALEDCFPAADVTAVNISNPNSSTFKWSHLPGAYNTQWQVYVDTVTVDIETIDEENLTLVEDTNYTIPAGVMTGGGMYNFYVRAYCGENNYSPWTTFRFGAGTIIMNASATADTVVGCGNVIYDHGFTAGYQGVTNSALVLKSSMPGKEVQIYGGLFGWGENAITLTAYDGIGTSGVQLWQYAHSGTINDSTMADSILATSTEGAMTIVFTCSGATMTHWGYELYTRCVDGKACYRPTNLASFGISSDEATLTWEGNAANYDVYYRAAGENDWSKKSVSDTFAVLTGLTATTDYTFYVQGLCGNNDSSYESHPATFRTRCAPYVVDAENSFFEGFEDFANNECFTLYMADAANTSLMTTVSSPVQEGTSSFRFAANGAASDYNQYLITPELQSDSSMQVEFYVKAVNDNIPMRFGTSTTGYEISDFTFEPATTIASSGITDGTWTKITKIVPSTTKYIAINYATATATTGYLFVDSLSVSVLASEEEPCFAPSITSTAATTNQITVNYSATGSVEYGITSGDTWDATIVGIPVSTNPLVLPGLAVASTYTIGLRTNCGDNGYSDWVTTTVTTLETPCDVPVDVVATDITLTSATISWNGGNATQWIVRYNEAGAEPLLDTVIAPTLALANLTPATTYTVQVRAICSATNISEWSTGITFNTLSCETPQNLAYSDVTMTSAKLDWTSAGSKWEVEVTSGDETNVLTASAKPYTITGLALGTDYTVRVRTVCDDKYFSEWSGSVNFTTATCDAPTNIVVTDITDNTAKVDWVSSATEWEIVLNNQVIKVTTHPYELTGLTKNTSYSIQVRALCDAEHESELSAVKSFTTTNVGIDDVNGNTNITLYPNPATTTVTVSLDGIEGQAMVSLIDLSGRQCGQWSATGSELTIDLSQLARGTYFVRIAGENGTAVRKLMVK